MSYCKKFIAGIKDINFTTEAAAVVRRVLWCAAYQDLFVHDGAIKGKIKKLELLLGQNAKYADVIQAYLAKQIIISNNIIQQLADIKTQTDIDVSADLTLDDSFIKTFAENFRDLPHLAYVLSDAPPAIKALQTRFYAEVLFKLPPYEQDAQLAIDALTENNLKDMCSEAISNYARVDASSELKKQCRVIAQKAIFELVRRISQDVSTVDTVDYKQYTAYINKIIGSFKDVASSDIIDDLSQYKNANGTSIGALIAEVESKLKISGETNWTDAEQITAACLRRRLCHHLRFGQMDRREYVDKRRANMALDLFKARDIRDVELFKDKTASDKQMRFLDVARYLKANKGAFAQRIVQSYSTDAMQYMRDHAVEAEMLCTALDNVVKNKDLKDKEKTTQTSLASSLVTTFKQELHSPIIFVGDAGVMTLQVLHYKFDVLDLYNTITEKGGWKSQAKFIIKNLQESWWCGSNQGKTKIDGPFSILKITGNSLASIAAQIDALPDTDPRKATLLEALSIAYAKVPKTDISALNLADNEEALLRKILEINMVQAVGSSVTIVYPLATAIEKIAAGAYKDVFSIQGLDNAVEIAYVSLATDCGFMRGDGASIDSVVAHFTGKNGIILFQNQLYDLNKDSTPSVRLLTETIANTKSIEELKALCLELPINAYNPVDLRGIGLFASVNTHDRILPLNTPPKYKQAQEICNKARTMVMSAQERQEKLAEFALIFSANSGDIAAKIEKLAKLFTAEYKSMQNTLGYDVQDLSWQDDIKLMAADFVRLEARVAKGEPALDVAEEEAYFTVIKTIAEKIAPQTLADVQFKVAHSRAKGPQEIIINDARGQTKKIIIDLKTQLPYSLIKPPGKSEFIFSYGGSRGVIAPFAGFAEVHFGKKKKTRFFTHSRLLGVGQQGAVKEVEGLLSGLNRVIKEGFVPKKGALSTFTETERASLLKGPLTSRDDPKSRVESDILREYSEAYQKAYGGGAILSEPKYYVTAKIKEITGAFGLQYHMIQDRAQGDTYADAANKQLNKYAKSDKNYHDPVSRVGSDFDTVLRDLKTSLAISQAVVLEAQRFQNLGFSHNDLKPENFNYKQNPDGSYSVTIIDWATGGFIRRGGAPEGFSHGIDGRFVKGDTYGVIPSLEILHGSRHGTLPYLSPVVVLRPENGIKNTVLEKADSPQMDDWALTAMTFGLCNRQAYFALVKGRTVKDYVVPGILEADGKTPAGLKIINAAKFNKYFNVGTPVTDADITSGAVYNDKQAVMFIPGSQREGEPLHLYRRLQVVKEKLQQSDPEQRKIIADIEKICSTVEKAIASGCGLTKEELQKNLQLAETCISQYEKLGQDAHKALMRDAELLKEILKKYEHKESINFDDLRYKANFDARSELEILCTCTTPADIEKAHKILNNITSANINDICLKPTSSHRLLWQECISTGHDASLILLLAKVEAPKEELIALVREQGLLHYALERGMTDVFNALISALKTSNVHDDEIFALMMCTYGPGKNSIHSQARIHWSTNALQIAIRNNNTAQLKVILEYLPESDAVSTSPATTVADDASDESRSRPSSPIQVSEMVNESLHLSATLSNYAAFKAIKQARAPESLLAIQYPPDNTSPYHLFLRDAKTYLQIQDEIKKFAKDFLLNAPIGTSAYPLLIAISHKNEVGFLDLLAQAQNKCTPEEYQQLLQQTDETGKNSLNYLLEHGSEKARQDFLKQIAQYPEVLLNLLKNPHPDNPLKNFLDTEKDVTMQFSVLKEILDAVCVDYTKAPEVYQEARIAALLINKDWLVTEAADATKHNKLRILLQNNSLSEPYKQILFTALQDAAVGDANTFYKKLLAEVTPRRPEDIRARVDKIESILPNINRNVAAQTRDVEDFLRALEKDVDVENVALQAQVGELGLKLQETLGKLEQANQRVNVLDKDLEKLKKDLSNAHKNTQKLEKNLAALKIQHDEGAAVLRKTLLIEQNTVKQLQAQIEPINRKLEIQKKSVASLELEVNKAKEENKELVAKIGSLEGKNLELQNIVDNQVQKIDEAGKSLTLVNNTLLEAESKSAELLVQSKVLLENNTALEARVAELVLEVEIIKEKLEQSGVTVFDFSSKLNTATKMLEDSQQSVNRLSMQIEDNNLQYQLGLQKLSNKNTNLDVYYDAQKRELQKNHEDNMNLLSAQLTEKGNVILQLNNTISQVQNTLQQKQVDYESLQDELIEANKACEAVNIKLQQSVAGNTELQDVVAKQVATINQINLELEDVKKKNLEAERLCITLMQSSQESLEKIDVLNKENATLKINVLELTLKLQQSLVEVQGLTVRLEGLSNNLLAGQEKIQKLEDGIVERENKYNTDLQEAKKASSATVAALQMQHEKAQAVSQKELTLSQQKVITLTSELETVKSRLEHQAELIKNLQDQAENQEITEILNTRSLNKTLKLEENRELIKEFDTILNTVDETLRSVTLECKELEDNTLQLVQKNAELLQQNQEITIERDIARQYLESNIINQLADRIIKARNLLDVKYNLLTLKELQDKISKHKQKMAEYESYDADAFSQKDQLQNFMQEWKVIKESLDKKAEDLSRDPTRHIYATVHTPRDLQFLQKGIVATINFHVYQYLVAKEHIEQFISENGLNVQSPSGHRYALSFKDKMPKAVLTAEGLPEGYTQEQLAITIINMIDNVRSKNGPSINFVTADPFVAKIAAVYAQYVQDQTEMVITLKITGCEWENNNDAQVVFDALKVHLTKDLLQKADWFKEAERNMPDDEQNTSGMKP